LKKEKKRRASGSKKLAWGKLNRGSGKRCPRKIKQIERALKGRRLLLVFLRSCRSAINFFMILGLRLPLPRLSLPQANFLLPLARRFI